MKKSGASSYALPPKRLREDYGTSGDAGASIAEKSLAMLQDLLDIGTLAAEDSASPSTAEANVASPSQPTGAKVFTDTFYIS
nr:hypothetical protein [Tanacetum cinerariifolium]